MIIFTTFIATIFSYSPALRGGFIWDDDRHVSMNPLLNDWDGLRQIWFHWGATPQYYPLTHTTFWIEHHLWGNQPTGYHITNLLLHCMSALLLWRLLKRLAVPGAELAAILFALHPVNVESVAWITERKNVLAMLFMLLSMIAFLKETRRDWWISLAFFICAMLSKTLVAPMPAALLVILWWKNRKLGRRDILRTLPFFVIGIGMGIMTALMERFHVQARGEDWDLSVSQRVIVAGRAVWFYIGKLIWPTRLTFSYPKWDVDAGSILQWIAPLAVVAVLAGLALVRKRWSRATLAAMLIFVGTLVPALGFINTYPMRYSFVADHFQYLSAPALFALFAAGWTMLFRRWRVLPAAPLVVILALLTWRQAHIYAGMESLWRDTLAKNPSSWMAANNLGVVLSGYDDPQHLHEALYWFDRVESLRPKHDKVRENRADALAKLGRTEEAVAIYRSEAALRPKDGGVLVKMARVFSDTGKTNEAVAEYEEALRIDPDADIAHLELGLLLAREHHTAEALPHLKTYVSKNPRDVHARVALGFAFLEGGDANAAREQFTAVLQIDPTSADALAGLEALRGQAPR